MTPLDVQASGFASKISEIAKIFGGQDTKEFVSDIIHSGVGNDGWRVEIHNDYEGFSLSALLDETFTMKASWTCSADGSGEWLKVEKSSFGVFLARLPRRPIFRYEFDSAIGPNLPKAHIHFHADHPLMGDSQPMRDAKESLAESGDGSARAKRRGKGQKKHNLSDLHFPVGGTRFRPCLEEILLMMVEEYGVTPIGMSQREAIEALHRNILEWRTSQVKAVIRDMPSLAIDYLESKGYRIVPDPKGVLHDRPGKLSAF